MMHEFCLHLKELKEEGLWEIIHRWSSQNYSELKLILIYFGLEIHLQ